LTVNGNGRIFGGAMSKKKDKERGGLCCPHCADSKYPCVTMEKQMRRDAPDETEEKNGEG
jgi:hypothetical protein